jgi:hypothetical protein
MVALLLAHPSRVHGESSNREFIMSCTYGVLAGTLVGLATLAFTDRPGDHKYRVARGASLGLYAGIALGLYIKYGISDAPEEPELFNGPSEAWRAPKITPTWALLPTISNEKWDGMGFVKEILQF